MDEKINLEKVIELLYQERPLDQQELSVVGKFLKSPANMEQLNAYLDEIPEAGSSGIKLKVGTIWEEIEKRVELTSPFRQAISIIRKYAAILLLPLFVYASWVTYQHFFAPAGHFTLATKKGEQTNITLPDGSSAWLNADTRVTYSTSYGKKSRELTVSGEAFFNVKKDAAKPFVVHVQNMDVKALGTAFNVKGYDHEAMVQTSLFEGKVDVKINSPDGHFQQQVLTPGQSLVFSKETDTASLKRFDQETVGAWKDRQLVFENTPFGEVIRNTERWFNVDIIYPVSQFEGDYLTLRLKKGESLERLFEIIDETIGIRYTTVNQQITITKKE